MRLSPTVRADQPRSVAPRAGAQLPWLLGGLVLLVAIAEPELNLYSVIGLAALLAIGFALYRVVRPRAARERATRRTATGAAAERHVRDELAQLDARHEVLANRLIPGIRGRAPEADLIVARADAVFVLEVKHSTEPVTFDKGGMWRAERNGAGRYLRDPRMQVRKQGQSLRQYLSASDIYVSVYMAAVVLAPRVSMDNSSGVDVFRSAVEARRAIEATPIQKGRGGDPRRALARLPDYERVCRDVRTHTVQAFSP